MPESDGTLRDILQGFNQMQSRLGLLPGSAQAQGIQPINTPAIKHPGEISQMVSMQMQQQVQAGVQQMQQIRMLQPPNVMSFMPPGGLGGGIPAGQEYAQQYQQRMGQIESGYQQPFQAQQMAQQMGMPGFQGMPSPVFMTQPSMGVFRPGMMPPPPIGIARTPPLLQTPFTPQLPAPMFQTPLQMEQMQYQQSQNQMFSGAMAGIPTAARIGMGIGGAALGARMGGRFGAIGAGIGAIGGGLLGFGPVGGMAEQGTAAGLQPAIERRAFGMQMQDMSRNFVVSGNELDVGGRGLSMGAGIQTANMMRRSVNKGETAGFNMRDMMGITSMAGDMGMMDMAQNSEQIVGQAKNIARGLSAFMQLANEPDVRRAMSQMSQMRAMGLTIPETTSAMQNAQQFARMAGTTVASLGQAAGAPGAMTFQQLGMTGGLGMQVGMGAGALARQAVAGGAFTPGQLAMAGGQAGVTQQLTESAGANLGITFPLMAMLSRNAEGQLTIDQEKRRRIDSGAVSLTEQAGMAQQNVEQLGGARVITELSTRLNELRDELGRQRGPMGTLLSTIQQGARMQQELGGTAGGVTLGSAFRALGMDPQQARTMEVMAKSPTFWQGIQQQMQQQAQEARYAEAARRDRLQESASLTSQMQRGLRPLGQFFEGIGQGVSSTYDDISGWFSERTDRNAAAEQGQAYVRESGRIRTGSAAAQRAVNQFIGGEGYQRWAARSTAASRQRAGEQEHLNRLGYGETGEAIGTAAINIGTGGISSVLGLSGPGMGMQAVQDRITVGGLGGSFAEMMPNIAGAILTATGVDKQWRERAQGVSRAAHAIVQGEGMASQTAVRLAKEGQTSYKSYMKAYGGDAAESFEVMKNDAVQGILGELKNRSHWYGSKAMTNDDMKKVIQKRIAKTMGEAGAAEYMKQHGDTLLTTVTRDVSRNVGEEHQGSWQQTKKGYGSQGFTAGKTLQDVVKSLESQEEDMEESLGFRAGFNVSEEGMQAYKDIAMTSNDDEMLLMNALALQGDDSGGFFNPAGAKVSADNRRKGKRMFDDLVKSGRMTPEAIEAAKQKFAGLKDKPDTVDALRRSGAVLGGLSAEDQKKQMGRIREGLLGRRGGLEVAKGAARLAEDVEGLQELARTGVDKATGTFEQKSVLSTMQKIAGDTAQMEALRKASPQAYAAIKQLQDAGENERGRGDAATKFQRALAQVGGRGGDKYGGKGAGGAAEQGIKEELGAVEKLAADLTGNAQEDFARTVPLFAKATADLHKATKNMNRTTEVQALKDKTRYIGLEW